MSEEEAFSKKKNKKKQSSYRRRLVLESVPRPDVDDRDLRREVGAEEALLVRLWLVVVGGLGRRR
jgi:hypothetical protein